MDPTVSSTVTTTDPADAERAVAVIVLAFSVDPAARWTYPDAHRYVTHFPSIVRAFGGRAFARGTAYHVDEFAGAALWLPPGLGPDAEGLQAIMQTSVAPALQADVAATFEQMERYHPREPHWYLPLIGVDPARQRKSHGSALLRHALAACDRDHTPAYLEATSPTSVPLYERHGFAVQGTIQVGSGPPIFPMLRPAR